MSGSDVLTRAAPPPDLVIRYGGGPDHVADVRLPGGPAASGQAGAGPGQAGAGPGQAQAEGGQAGARHGQAGDERGQAGARAGRAGSGGGPAPLVVFFHGGFWRVAFGRTHTGPLATALAAAGYAVCVPEFRRTGQLGGGWPGTFDDVAAAMNALPALVREAAGPGVIADGPALLAGHSAGGHLALWAAGRHLLPANSAWRMESPSARGVIVLAGASRLAESHEQGLGDGAAAALMGGGPDQYPQRYRNADPAGLLPLGCPVRLVHGAADDVVPVEISRTYASLARQAGDDTSLLELPGTDHLDVIDPVSDVWPQVLAVFAELAGPARG